MIPKKIHHIWLGEKKYAYSAYRESWMKFHPNYEFYLWDELNIPKNILKKETIAIIEDSNVCPMSKSDSLRFDILRVMGGAYFDADMEALKCLDRMFDENDEFIGEIFPNVIGAGILGSIQNGQWITKLSNKMNENILNNIDLVHNNFMRNLSICGTRSLRTELSECKKIYPMKIFYPNASTLIDDAYTKHHFGYQIRSSYEQKGD